MDQNFTFRQRIFASFVLLLFTVSGSQAQTKWFVMPGAPAAGPGTSWAAPIDLQTAINIANKRILKIEANKDIAADINKDRLEYEYLNDMPVIIKVISKQGVLYRKCLLGFSPANQLQELSWQIDLGTGFVPEQTLTFSYYPDGNLKKIDFHNFAVGPFLENFYTDTFENYDTKTNVDGFSLLHTPLHHPVLLPAIRLQLNNPGRVFRTGVLTATYDARYSYTYDAAGRPLTRTGPVTFRELNGTTGEFISTTTYTYN